MAGLKRVTDLRARFSICGWETQNYRCGRALPQSSGGGLVGVGVGGWVGGRPGMGLRVRSHFGSSDPHSTAHSLLQYQLKGMPLDLGANAYAAKVDGFYYDKGGMFRREG